MYLSKDSGKIVDVVTPPRQQLHWQNVSDITILELWSLLKACNFQGEAWSLNCG